MRTSRQFSRTALVEATSLGLGGECPKCQERASTRESEALGVAAGRGSSCSTSVRFWPVRRLSKRKES